MKPTFLFRPNGHAREVKGGLLKKPTNGRFKERRSTSAAAHGKPMSGAFAHLIASLWTSPNTFRRSLALNLTRMPNGALHASLGQRPGSWPTHYLGALKGRPNRGMITRSRPRHGPPLEGLGCRGDGVPGALPQADVDAAPLGLWRVIAFPPLIPILRP
jgi:hypothetical protein